MAKQERIGILLRRKRTQTTFEKPTFHNIETENIDYTSSVGTASQKRLDAGDIFIASLQIESLVKRGVLKLNDELGEAHYFTEAHNSTGRTVRRIHRTRDDTLKLLAERNLISSIRQDLEKVVHIKIITKLKKAYPRYKVAFSKEEPILDYQKNIRDNTKKVFMRKPNL